MAFINEIYHFKKILKDIEKATKKCVHVNGAIEFNKTCLTNGIFPKFYYSWHLTKKNNWVAMNVYKITYWYRVAQYQVEDLMKISNKTGKASRPRFKEAGNKLGVEAN